MSNIAVKTALSDDDWMPRRSKSGYLPPKKTDAVLLSSALSGTDRLPEAKQSDFLGGKKNPGDTRIFFAGDLSLLKRPCVSIVGTREVSDAGIVATEWVARKLVDAGVVIVSGLAYG